MNTFRDRDAEKVFSVDEFWQFVIGNYGAIDETASYTVQGIYQPNIAGRNDEGWCYEKLASENGDNSLTILTSLKQREFSGRSGSVIRVRGNLNKKSKDGEIKHWLKANFITKVSVEPKFTENDRDKAFAILEYGRQSADATLSIFRIFAKHRRPYIGLICCRYAKAWKDFEVGLAEAKDKYNIDEIKTDSSSAEVYNSALAQAIPKGYDAICIMRGGGGIERTESRSLIKTISKSNTPIMMGLGHCEDNLFSKFVASSSCGTPQGLGTRLKEIANLASMFSSRSLGRSVTPPTTEGSRIAVDDAKSANNPNTESKPQLVTVNGQKVTDAHAFQGSDNAIFFVATLDRVMLKPQRMKPEDVVAMSNKTITIEQLMTKYYPEVMAKKVEAEQIKLPQTIEGRYGTVHTIERFNAYKEQNIGRSDYGRWKFYARIDGQNMSVIGSKDMMSAWFNRTAPLTEIVRNEFGAALRIPDAYKRFKLPEGVKDSDVKVHKVDKDNRYHVSVTLGDGLTTPARPITYSEAGALFDQEGATVTKSQLAAKYLMPEMMALVDRRIALGKNDECIDKKN